jgi:hypothetical protein
MKPLKFILSALLVFTFFACSSDDDSSPKMEEDVQQLVENFVTPELIATLQELGFTFRDGLDSPDLSGLYLFENHALEASNIPDDVAQGTLFSPNTFGFSNLNANTRTFSFTGVDGTGSSFGDVTDTFFSGSGNNFSAYVKLSVTTGINGSNAIILLAISGTITDEGIVNAEDALIMLDDNGDENEVLIENGDGRLLIDVDGIAERQ